MANIIDAICTIISRSNHRLVSYTSSGRVTNRMNATGKPLEEYVYNAFADTFDETDPVERMRRLSSVFSYIGNDSNPPDAILRGGDAIEVKKTKNNTSTIQLNSSTPKSKLLADSSMISRACRDCENWTEKDIVYIVGQIEDNVVKTLSIVYGYDYCASNSVYENVKNQVSNGLLSIPNIDWAETNELGRVNAVDPLRITSLRVRGMWFIEPPIKVFDYVYQRDVTKSFNLMAIINDQKIEELGNFSRLQSIAEVNPNLRITDIQIKNPDNPADLRNAKLITFSI